MLNDLRFDRNKMGTEQWLAFVTASLIFFMIPGPDMMLIACWSAREGFRVGCEAAMGTILGLIMHTIATSLGLAALLAASTSAFTMVKWAGSIYLIGLGIVKLRNKKPLKQETVQNRKKHQRPFLQALCTNLLNPKVILFFVAFLPHFIDPVADAQVQLLMLGLSYAVISLVWYLIFVAVVAKAGQSLSKNQTAQQLTRWLSGTIMIGFGVSLAALASHP